VREWWANVGNGSTAAAEVVIKEGITKEMLVTTSFFYRRERDSRYRREAKLEWVVCQGNETSIDAPL
jgi:hypothetical protein